jgi:hypothetical protein
MIVRSIDGNNDWLFGKGKNDYKKDRSAIAQNIKTRLQSFLGDCFFALSDGIDWFNLLGSKNVLELRLAISSVILNTQGVTEIVSVNVIENNSSRTLSVQYEVNTVLGRVQDALTEEGLLDA